MNNMQQQRNIRVCGLPVLSTQKRTKSSQGYSHLGWKFASFVIQFAELCAACDLCMRLAGALCALLLLWACFSVLQIAAISGAIVLISGSDSCEDLARKCLSLPEHILLRIYQLSALRRTKNHLRVM